VIDTGLISVIAAASSGGGLQIAAFGPSTSMTPKITFSNKTPTVLLLTCCGFEQSANGDGAQITQVLLDGVDQGARSVFPVNTNIGGAVVVTPRASDVVLFTMFGLLYNVPAGTHTLQVTWQPAFSTGLGNFSAILVALYS
jgi:hypothetical protein